MERVLDLYCGLLKGVIALCLAVMVVLVFGNVVLRYGFNSGITVSEELSRWLLVWLTFLGAIVAVREHSHLGVDSLVRMLSPMGKRICFIINYCMMLFADWLLLTGSWQQTLINWDDRAPATGLSIGIFILSGSCSASRPASCCSTTSIAWSRGRPAKPRWSRSGNRRSTDVRPIRTPQPFEAPTMTIAVFTFSLLGAMALGMPIAFALIICGVALMSAIGMFDSQIVAQNVINGADSFPLMAIPFFMLAGELMNKGGLAKRIVNVALVAVGHLRGGLGYVTILASCILASLSGSAAADAAALAALLVPMMVAAGHKKSYAAGLVAAGGIIAPVIPPSIGFVIFGVAAGVSISKLFLAGIVPGLMLGVGLCVSWWWVVRKENLTPPPRASAAEMFKAVVDGFWALMLPVIIVVGLRFGIFTPTEAAVVVAVYSLFVATCIYRELKFSQLYDVFVSAAVTTSIVMFLVAAALVSSWLITVSEISTQIVDLLRPFMGNNTLLMFAIMVIVVIVGTALDMTPTILILTPILMPVIKTAGIDPVYFGVLFIINNAIGLITPPVGVVLNVVCGVSKISMEEIIKGVWPFMIAQLVVLFLMVLFPGLVTIPAKWFAG